MYILPINTDTAVHTRLLLLADNWLAVVTGHIIEARGSLHDDGQTVLVSLCIVRLARAPPVLGRRPPTGPAHTPGTLVDSSSGPEVGLALPGQEAGELPLLVGAVQGDGRHPVSLAVGGSLAGREGGAAQPPGDEELLPTEGVVGFTVTAGSTSSTSTSTSDWLLGGTTGCSSRSSTDATDEVGQTPEEALRVDGEDGDQEKETN